MKEMLVVLFGVILVDLDFSNVMVIVLYEFDRVGLRIFIEIIE